MRRMWWVFVCFSNLLIAKPEEKLEGKVISVVDGNTFELLTPDEESYKIILFGIDCPEIGQPFAEEAKTRLEKIILKKTVTVMIQGKDRKGNRLGTLLVKQNDPRYELLSEGLAWTSERNPIPNLEQMRREASESQKGIWKEADPVPPWIYRRQQSMLQVKSSW